MLAMKVLVTGSTGLVGMGLLNHLARAGHEVTPLVRQENKPGSIYWNPASGDIDISSLEGFDAAVHLAGENIASGRWTQKKKDRIRDSRVKGTRLLAESLARVQRPPRVLISASAVGYYGDRGTEVLKEDSPSGRGFLPEVCRQWEAATDPATRKGIRVVHTRFGIILSANGGALAKMLLPFKLGIAGKIGSGRQYMSWISLDDVCGVIVHAIEASSLHGAVNTVSPNPVTNLEFTKALGRTLSRPTIFPMPSAAARIVLGEMANDLLLASARVEPVKLQSTRYAFQHRDLEPTLRYLLRRSSH
jgi:uncharacterized protein (TIGR01777 family)